MNILESLLLELQLIFQSGLSLLKLIQLGLHLNNLWFELLFLLHWFHF